jgi:hypothetical protein
MQCGEQVPLVVAAVEVAKEGDERRGDDEHVLGVAERVAQQHAGPLRYG